jgi:hypothetical protein
VHAGFTRKDGSAVTDADLPWLRHLEKGESAHTELAVGSQTYAIECTLAEDSTLGRTVLVEFTPVKQSAVTEPLHFRLAAAK